MLKIDDPANFQAAIYGFSVGNIIDVAGISDVVSYTYTPISIDNTAEHALTIKEANGKSATLYIETANVGGLQPYSNFSFASDGAGGTLITVTPPTTIIASTPSVVEKGQTTVIGTVTPSMIGDTLTLAETGGIGALSLGAAQVDGTQQVIYTAPATVAASVVDVVSYTVTDNNGAAATGSASVQLDAGPTVTPQAPSVVEASQTTVLGTVTPGVAFDALSLKQTGGSGTVALQLVSGVEEVIYTAPASVPTTTTDTVTYTVSDQHDDAIASGGPETVQLAAAVSITAPGTATVGIGRTSTIGGISVSEGPTSSGGTFTAVLTDTNGLLSATTLAAAGGGTITSSNGGKTLTISGTLAQLNADLTTLADTDPLAAPDALAVSAKDSFGNAAASQTIAVTVTGPGFKYWTGSGWILQDGTAITAPGAADTGILGGPLTGFVLPQSGTVSVAGLTPVAIGSLVASGNGPWSIVGTGGVDDVIDNLIVPVGSTVRVDTTIAVKKLTIETLAGTITPANVTLSDGLPPGALIDFAGKAVSYTYTINGTGTHIVASAAGVAIANINLAGVVSFAGAPISDGNGGTEITITGTLPLTIAPDFILSVGGANDINRGTGESIIMGASAIQPNGYQGTTLTATSITNPATGLPYSLLSVPFRPSAAIPNQFEIVLPYDPTNPADAYENQPWTFTYANGTATLGAAPTPSLVGVAPPPFASNVTFSGSSSNPTFTWNYPAGSVNGVFFDIYDDTNLTPSGTARFVYSAVISGSSGTFTVPSALAGGLTLEQGHHYTLDLYGVISRNTALPLSNQNSSAWSQSYFDFEPTTGASTPAVYLPTITQTGGYQFNMTVIGGQTYFIDPAIATGYSYATSPGNPNFASVLLPAIQTTSYLVTFLNNGKQVTSTVAPNTVFAFPTGGVSSFTVTGIAAADNLNPANATAFVTGLTFVSSGAFTGTQTPLIDPGPTAGAVTSSVTLGKSIDLTSAILAQVTPGLIGDTETLTAAGPTSEGGQVTLVKGDLTYTGQGAILKHIPANGSLTDTFTYTVADELGDSATGSVKVTVSNPAKIINGSAFGFDVIRGGTQTNIVNAHGSFNKIYESGGNDVVNAGNGFGTVFTGTGDVVVNLKGYINDVTGGNGNDTVNILSGGLDQIMLGSGNDAITTAPNSLGFDTFVLNGSRASALLYGSDNIAFVHGGTDTITDDSQGLLLKIGIEGGSISLSNFIADRSGRIDLTGGVGGFKNVHAVLAALHSDGNGGTLLSLGASGQIDFMGVAQGTLTASRFQVG